MEKLAGYRKAIDEIDDRLVSLLAERFNICREVAAVKRTESIPMMQSNRVQEVIERNASHGASVDIDPSFMRNIYRHIIDESCRVEDELINDVDNPISPENPLWSNIVILGGGGVGSLFANELASFATMLSVVDIAENQHVHNNYKRIAADVSKPTLQLQKLIEQADLVIAALPAGVFKVTALKLLPLMKPGSLFVETLSVKTPVEKDLRCVETSAELLGINPMFGPSLGFRGGTILTIEYQGGNKVDEFVEWLSARPTRIHPCSADEHDELTATFQALTHAAVLSFGIVANRRGVNLSQVIDLGPPPFRALSFLLARILSGNPEVNEEIQLNNPNADSVRTDLAQAIRELSDSVECGKFSVEFDRLKTVLGEQKIAMEVTCASMFEAIKMSSHSENNRNAASPQPTMG